MKNAFAVILLTISLATSDAASARELNGVNLQDKVTIEGRDLSLNGMGLRTKMMVKVYVAGLYVERPSNNAAAVISSDQVKRVELVMLRDLDKQKIVDAINEGFEKNSKAALPALRERLGRFNAAIPDLKQNDQLVITYLPGKGTTVTTKGGKNVTVEGKDFADALFSVWLGASPVDAKLKSGLLGE